MGKKKTNIEFLADLQEKQPTIIAMEAYRGSATKIEFKCSLCGYVWKAAPVSVLHGLGCPNYNNHPGFVHPRYMGQEAFSERVRKIHPTITVLEEYKGSKTKLRCRCEVCGNEWMSTPNNLLCGRGCKQCGYHKGADKRRKTLDDFVKEMAKENPSIEVVGKYVSTMEKVRVRCKECGHAWDGLPLHLLRGVGCPKCKGGVAYTNEEFLRKFDELDSDITILGSYINSKTPLLCRCDTCSFEWMAQPGHLLKGHGCPRCASTGTSKAEQFIYCYFETLLGKGNVINRCRDLAETEIDIYFPAHKYAIEYGSWYWHADRVDGDIEKEKACREKGVELLTVYDAFDDNYDGPLPKHCKVYGFDLCSEEGHRGLYELLNDITGELRIKFDSSINLREIEKRATRGARKKTEATFIAEVSRANPKIEVVGPYTGSQNKVHVRCKVCGHEWDARPYHLKRGSGCKKCAARNLGKIKTKSNEQFLADLKVRRPDVEALEKYRGSETPIMFRCKVCGNQWLSTPEYVFQGQRCTRWREHPNKRKS